MQKSGSIKNLSLESIRSTTNNNCAQLVDAISSVVDCNLGKSSTVVSIFHRYEYKANVSHKASDICLDKKEVPGKTLEKKDEPTELHLFTYERLKKTAIAEGNRTYRGKLYGTIELCSCDKKANCTECEGTGICSSCEGEKQIECPVCEGDKECISCNGTGIYTCTNCEGSGVCPECDNGWYTCDDCYGDGTISCPDCNGSGNFIDTTCNKCDGSGYYDYWNNKQCRACGGTGRYVVECRRCKGHGTTKCDSCDGDGGWDCKKCHGSGKCSHCHGDGGFTCKACDGSGTCGKCKGKGKIWCPACHGKGKCFDCKGEKLVTCPRCNGLGEYQTYTEYSLSDLEFNREYCSLSIDKDDIQHITGDLVYKDYIYEFFAGQKKLFDDQTILKHVADNRIDVVKKWISLKDESFFVQVRLEKDYIKTSVELVKIPVTIILLRCNSENYPIWIVGNNKVIFYDQLPSFTDRLLSRFKKIIGI